MHKVSLNMHHSTVVGLYQLTDQLALKIVYTISIPDASVSEIMPCVEKDLLPIVNEVISLHKVIQHTVVNIMKQNFDM